jgi:predicted nucleotidyltransferase
MILPKEIKDKLQELEQICKKHKVNKLFVFGSASKGGFKPKSSDIDLIVDIEEMDPVSKGELLISLWNNLEELFNRKVDLLTTKKITNPFLLREIENSKQLLYDRAS